MRLLYKTGAMESLRKWFYKPKRDDRSLLARFFFADETLNMVAAELDSFDGREDPERCSTLVNQLRHTQEHVLNITGQIMDQLLGNERVPRGFRVKFPEDVLQDNLAGQLWFGAECLAAGSSIMNREEESAAMRPLAKALTRSLESVRALLRDHCLRCNQHGLHACSDLLIESLKIFDRLFAEFELCYVSAMVAVKSPREFEVQQHICVLFSETLQRARRIGLLTQEQVDDYDPALMFAIPRLAIVSGLLIFPNGPLSIDKSPAEQMSDMFRPFRTLLHKIRELLWTLDRRELYLLEKLLCTNEDIANIRSSVDVSQQDGSDATRYPDISEFVARFYSDYSHCKDMLSSMGCEWGAPGATGVPGARRRESSSSINESDYLPDSVEVFTPLLDGMRRLNQLSPTEELEQRLDNPSPHLPEETFHFQSPDTFQAHRDLYIRLKVPSSESDAENSKPNETDAVNENINTTFTRIESRSSTRSTGSGSRKSSRNESISSSNDFMVRNLSSNGLLMFDPLAGSSTSTVNVNPMASDNNVLLPDQNLVSNLLEQVSEIADRLSSISYKEHHDSAETSKTMSLVDSSISNLLQDQTGQMYSYSTNDVSNMGAERMDPDFPITRDSMNYSPTRIDKVMSNMPSTSHGYLIPNAISHEPAILASLSNNNSVIFEDESALNPINNPMMMSQQSVNLANIENEMFGDSISVANANLSSLLLTSEEFQNRFLVQAGTLDTPSETAPNFDEASFYTANDVTITNEIIGDYNDGQNVARERARFLVGYESDSNEPTPGDSGICTENTSLDRSPDSEIKDLNSDKSNCEPLPPANARRDNDSINSDRRKTESRCSYYMDQNRILSNDNNVSGKSLVSDSNIRLRSSFSSSSKGGVTINITDCGEDGPADVISSLQLNYSESSGGNQKNEAGSSQGMMRRPEFVSSVECKGETANSSDISINEQTGGDASPNCDRSWKSEVGNVETDVRTEASVKVDNCDNNISVDIDELAAGEASVRRSGSADEQTSSSSSIGVLNQRNLKKAASPKSKKGRLYSKEAKMPSPGRAVAEEIDNCDNNISAEIEENDTRQSSTVGDAASSQQSSSTDAEQTSSSSSVSVLNQRKMKKPSSPKSKKGIRSRFSSRETKMWSPGRVVLENRSYVEQRSPMRLNLEQLVDDGGGGGSCSSQSSATSSFHSDCADDEEIALALQAQELAARHHTRAKFRSSEDLIHRLFVCIAGVADQLQTNFASDLRNILKSVFLMNQTPEVEPEKSVEEEVPQTTDEASNTAPENTEDPETSRKNNRGDTIEYEVSESEVLTNGDSFDSIYSAEEVYADHSPTSQRSEQSLRIPETASNVDENVQNDVNERRHSQPLRLTPYETLRSTRRNTSPSSGLSNNSTREFLDNLTSDNEPDENVNPRTTSRQKDAQSSRSNRSSSSNSSDSNQNTENYISNSYDRDSESLNSQSASIVRQKHSGHNDENVRSSSRVHRSETSGYSDENRDRGVRSQSVCATVERAPEWVPDIAAPDCMRCGAHFTAFRRRHHCRNCGKVFCAACSANSVPLPRFGQPKAVRVCEECFQSLAKRSCAPRPLPCVRACTHT